jgi:hypothetical protein
VGASRAVHELEVREDRLARSRETDRDASLHDVEVESPLEVFPSDDPRSIAGMWRNEHLGIDAGHLDVRRIRHFDGKRSLGRTERIRVELCALVTLSDKIDDTIEVHCEPAACRRLHDDQVVELNASALLYTNPEVQGGSIHGTENDTSVFAGYGLELRL